MRHRKAPWLHSASPCCNTNGQQQGPMGTTVCSKRDTTNTSTTAIQFESTSQQPLSVPLRYVILPLLQQVKLSRGQHHRCVQSQVTQLSSWSPTVRVSPDALHAVNMVVAQCLACCVLQATHRSQAGDSRDWHTQRGSVFHTTSSQTYTAWQGVDQDNKLANILSWSVHSADCLHPHTAMYVMSSYGFPRSRFNVLPAYAI